MAEQCGHAPEHAQMQRGQADVELVAFVPGQLPVVQRQRGGEYGNQHAIQHMMLAEGGIGGNGKDGHKG